MRGNACQAVFAALWPVIIVAGVDHSGPFEGDNYSCGYESDIYLLERLLEPLHSSRYMLKIENNLIMPNTMS